MKQLLSIFIALFFSATLFGQPKTDTSKKSMMKDCVMMENGKMMVSKAGSMMPMNQDMTMRNGTMVTTSGQVKMKNGKTMMMKDGDCVYMDGKMGHMSMKGKQKGKMQ